MCVLVGLDPIALHLTDNGLGSSHVPGSGTLRDRGGVKEDIRFDLVDITETLHKQDHSASVIREAQCNDQRDKELAIKSQAAAFRELQCLPSLGSRGASTPVATDQARQHLTVRHDSLPVHVAEQLVRHSCIRATLQHRAEQLWVCSHTSALHVVPQRKQHCLWPATVNHCVKQCCVRVPVRLEDLRQLVEQIQSLRPPPNTPSSFE
mmetsp:Transcript_3221/g.8005  ORF Transcript_3221/g.8005 Transcript_3221/m.8005 type:complete len:207 (-) Transcript_3221:114-734(-)